MTLIGRGGVIQSEKTVVQKAEKEGQKLNKAETFFLLEHEKQIVAILAIRSWDFVVSPLT
jgi:hypothetical protein